LELVVHGLGVWLPVGCQVWWWWFWWCCVFGGLAAIEEVVLSVPMV
jgi:hypothetical protein